MRPLEQVNLKEIRIPKVTTDGEVMVVRRDPDNPRDIQIMDNRITFKPVINEDERQTLAIHSSRYKLYPNEEFIEVVRGVTGDTFEGYINQDWNRLDIYYYPKDYQIDVNPEVGDIIRLGLRFTNSYDGNTALRTEFIGMRLVCMNGMTTRGLLANLSTRHTTKSLDAQAFKEIVSQIFANTDLALLKDIFIDAQKMTVDDPLEWIEALAFINGLPDALKVAVQEHILKRNIEVISRYKLWNILTKMITHGWGAVKPPSRSYSEGYLEDTHRKINDILTVSEDRIQKTIKDINKMEEVQDHYKELITVVAER